MPEGPFLEQMPSPRQPISAGEKPSSWHAQQEKVGGRGAGLSLTTSSREQLISRGGDHQLLLPGAGSHFPPADPDTPCAFPQSMWAPRLLRTHWELASPPERHEMLPTLGARPEQMLQRHPSGTGLLLGWSEPVPRGEGAVRAQDLYLALAAGLCCLGGGQEAHPADTAEPAERQGTPGQSCWLPARPRSLWCGAPAPVASPETLSPAEPGIPAAPICSNPGAFLGSFAWAVEERRKPRGRWGLSPSVGRIWPA